MSPMWNSRPFRWGEYLVAVISLVFILPVCGLAPLNTYEQVFQYSDGQISVNQTAQLGLTHLTPGGDLRVGDYTLRVRALPPKFRYRSREVGRIPKSSQIHYEEVCLVESLTNYQTSQTSWSPAQVQTSAASRRLLAAYTNEERQSWFDMCKVKTTTEWRLEHQRVLREVHSHLKTARALFENVRVFDEYHVATAGGQQYDRWGQPIPLPNVAYSPSRQLDKNFYDQILGVMRWLGGWEGYYKMTKVDHGLGATWYDNQPIRLNQDVVWTIKQSPEFEFAQAGVNFYRALIDNGFHRGDHPRYFSDEFWDERPVFECNTFPGVCVAKNGPAAEDQGACGSNGMLGVGVGVGATSLARDLAERAISDVELTRLVLLNVTATIQDRFVTLEDFVNKTGVLMNKTDEAFRKLAELETEQQRQFGDILETVTANAARQNQTERALGLLNDKLGRTVEEITRDMYYLSLNFTSGLEASDNATNAKIALVVGAMNKIAEKQGNQISEVYSSIQRLGSSVQTVSANLQKFIRQKQFRRALTDSYFTSSESFAKTSDEIPLVSTSGFPPQALSLSHQGAFLDTIAVSYSPSANLLVDLQFDVYLNTQRMLDFGYTWTSTEHLIQWMGVNPYCRIPTLNETLVVVQGAIQPECIMWTNLRRRECSHPGFAAAYSGATCQGTLTIGSESYLRTVDATLATIKTACDQLQGGTFSVYSSQLSQVVQSQSSGTMCNMTVPERLAAHAGGHADPFSIMLSFLWVTFQGPFQVLLAGLELKRYGRLPDGIKTEMMSLGYTPSRFNEYDGGSERVSCMRGYWLSVHPETLPLYSLTYDSSSNVNEMVLAEIIDGPSCLNETSGLNVTCYQVGNDAVRTNFVFQSAQAPSVPSSMVVVGNPMTAQYDGVYDVPESLVQTSRNPLVREHLVTYLLMPPDTRVTLGHDFFRRVTGELFNAYAGSASANEYRYPAVLDNEGYPVCNVAGGVPLDATFVPPVDNCMLPFVWSGAYFDDGGNNFAGAPPVNGAHAESTACRGVFNYDSLGRTQRALIYTRTEEWTPNTLDAASIARIKVVTDSFEGRSNVAFSVGVWVTMTVDVDWMFNLAAESNAAFIRYGHRATENDPTYTLLTMQMHPFGTPSDLSYFHFTLMNGYPSVCLEKAGTVNWECFNIQRKWNFVIDRPVHFVFTVDFRNGGRHRVFANGHLLFDGSMTSITNYLGSQVASTLMPALLDFSNPDPIVFTVLETTGNVVFEFKQLVLYAWPIAAVDVMELSVCDLVSLEPRCWLSPSSVVKNWLPALPTPPQENGPVQFMTQTPRGTCLSFNSGTFLSASSQVSGPAVTFAIPSNGIFTVSGWMRYPTFTASSGSDVFVIYRDADSKIVIASSGLSSTLILRACPTSGACKAWQWTLGPTSTPRVANTVFDGNLHFLAFSVNGNTATLIADGTTSESKSFFTPPAYVLLTSFPSPLEMVFIFSSALSSEQARGDMLCQLDSYSMNTAAIASSNVALYQLPVASCVSTSSTSLYGYCKHAMMCGGTCSVYAVMDRVRQTFRPLQIVCEPGYLLPDCKKKCALRDVNGMCVEQKTNVGDVDNIGGLPLAYAVNGYWCVVLKAYQVSMFSVNGQNFMDLDAREFSYIADVSIPSGKVTTLLPAAHCPTTAVGSSGDGSLWLMFTNAFNSFAPLYLSTGATGTCLPPAVCCESSYALTVAPLTTQSWSVPSLCQSLSIGVYVNMGRGRQLCMTINTTTAATEAFSSPTAPVAANVQIRLTNATDELLFQIQQSNQQLATTMLQLQYASVLASASGNATLFKELVDSIASVVTTRPTFVPSVVNRFNNDTEWNEIQENIARLRAKTEAGLAAQGAGLDRMQVLATQFTGLSNEVTAANNALQVAVANDLAQAKITDDALTAAQVEIRRQMEATNAALADIYSRYREQEEAVNGLSPVELGLLITGAVLGGVAALGMLAQFIGPKIANYVHGNTGEEIEGEGEAEEEEAESDSAEAGEPEEEETEETSTERSAAAAIANSRQSWKEHSRFQSSY